MDLYDDLLTCSDWDENELFSPHVHKLEPPSFLPDSAPLAPALPADVSMPTNGTGRADVFINDIITVGYANKRWKRLCGAALLALHMFRRPAHNNEPVPRDDLLSLNKLIAEGSSLEVKTALD